MMNFWHRQSWEKTVIDWISRNRADFEKKDTKTPRKISSSKTAEISTVNIFILPIDFLNK